MGEKDTIGFLLQFNSMLPKSIMIYLHDYLYVIHISSKHKQLVQISRRNSSFVLSLIKIKIINKKLQLGKQKHVYDIYIRISLHEGQNFIRYRITIYFYPSNEYIKHDLMSSKLSVLLYLS